MAAGTTVADECGAPDVLGPEVVVTVRNGADTSRYLEVSYAYRIPTVRFVPAGQSVPLPMPGNCDRTCDELAAYTCDSDGPCGVIEILELAPGASYEGRITATRYTPRNVSEDCPGASRVCDECFEARPLSKGDYLLAVTVGSGPDCSVGPCDCVPTAEGVCVYQWNYWLLDPTLVGVPFSVPGVSEVEVVLE